MMNMNSGITRVMIIRAWAVPFSRYGFLLIMAMIPITMFATGKKNAITKRPSESNAKAPHSDNTATIVKARARAPILKGGLSGI